MPERPLHIDEVNAPRRAARTGLLFAALGLAIALGGCNPPGYGACYTVCNPAPYAPAYPSAYAGGGFAFATPFDDPFVSYTQRIVTVTPTAGNAQTANTALQTATPWPRGVYNTRIPGNGAQMVRAVKEFEAGPKKGGVSAGEAAALGGIGAAAGGAATTGGAGGSTGTGGASMGAPGEY
jgi:hypothetical protein